jgi:phosphate transport system protein
MDHHIDHHFDEALAALKQQIVIMCSKVQIMLADAVRALGTGDTRLADQIGESDHAINALEVAIDEQCLELLVRYQPAARDLRFITRGLKIVTDLERVGDLAVNIARRSIEITQAGGPPIDLTEMAAVVQGMLRDATEAFVTGDDAKALDVLRKDDIVDDLTRRFVNGFIDRAMQEPQQIGRIFPSASVVRYLERVADHSTNIAELAIFMVKGRDVRHGAIGNGRPR